jgi:hypothetical protein
LFSGFRCNGRRPDTADEAVAATRDGFNEVGAVCRIAQDFPQPVDGFPNGTVLFNVQHHWVTESGDQIFFGPAVATTVPLSQTRFAFVSYPAHITGGTGRFAGATGDLTNIGEADLQAGTAIRYSGQVCFAEQD